MLYNISNFSFLSRKVALFFCQTHYKNILLFSGKKIMAPLSWFNVTRGSTYRFRCIGVGSLYPLRISVDNHNISIVASDGYDIKPMVVESFIINPGERYDFLLEANQQYDNYWIRAVSMEVFIYVGSLLASLTNKLSRFPLTIMFQNKKKP